MKTTVKATNRVAALTNGSKSQEQVTLTFTLERETKNCLRFAEVGDEPVVGTLYVKKSACKDWQGCTVTIARN